MQVFFKTSLPNLVPVPVAVVGEQMANERFYFDTPIVPTAEARKDPGEQFNEYTTRFAIKLGELFPFLSPQRIDHAVTGTFGYVANDLRSVLGLGSSGSTREKEAGDMFLIGRLFQRGGRTGTRPKSFQELYDLLEDAQRKEQSDRNPETGVQRQRRLMLTDAAKAVSALIYVRRYTDATAIREAITKEALAIAQDVLRVVGDDKMTRGRFAEFRKKAEARKEAAKRRRAREKKAREAGGG